MYYALNNFTDLWLNKIHNFPLKVTQWLIDLFSRQQNVKAFKHKLIKFCFQRSKFSLAIRSTFWKLICVLFFQIKHIATCTTCYRFELKTNTYIFGPKK